MSAAELLPGPAAFAAFAAAVLVLNATPGVDVLLTVSRTVQGGVRAGVAAALGIGSGCTAHALAAAFGLAALLALHAQALQTIQWAGAAYLVWLGLVSLRQAWRVGQPPTLMPALPRPWWSDFRAGLLTNLLNPKVALFFLAFLPQFVPPSSPAPTLSFLLLGTVFVVQGTLFLLVLVVLAARAARARPPPWLARGLHLLSGWMFLALAWRLLTERPVTA